MQSTAFIRPLKKPLKPFSPRMGTLYQSKRAQLEGMRFFPVSKFQSYVIYYRQHPQGIEIVRVLHAHIDSKKRLEPEE